MEMLICAVVLLLVNSMFNLMCFFYGAKIEQKVINNETIELPKIKKSDIPLTREYKEEKEEVQKLEKEIQRINTIWDNIDSYNGTGIGQRRVE